MKTHIFLMGLIFIFGCSSVKIQHSVDSKAFSKGPAVENAEVFDTTKLHESVQDRMIIGGDTIISHHQLHIYTEQREANGKKIYVQANSHAPINEYNYSSTLFFTNTNNFIQMVS